MLAALKGSAPQRQPTLGERPESALSSRCCTRREVTCAPKSSAIRAVRATLLGERGCKPSIPDGADSFAL
jgi:hypothetical protein